MGQKRNTESEMVDYDDKGRRVRHKPFVPYNHPLYQPEEGGKHASKPPAKESRDLPTREASNGREGEFSKPKSARERVGSTRGSEPPRKPSKLLPRPRKGGAVSQPEPSLEWGADARTLRKRYAHRKFLFPLLDQGPNNQYLQFRVALARARALNRTIVLPLWLPHNPKFQHLHAGAPPYPSRDKKLDQISYAFESTFDPEAISKYVRTLDLKTFRMLSGECPFGGCSSS